MKKFIAALIGSVLCLCLEAQNQPVKMSGGKMTIADVFAAIETQTGLSVDYDASAVNTAESVSVSGGSVTVQNLLDSVLPGSGYSFSVNKSHIIVRPVPAAQPNVVKGIVVDSKGEPVIGAGVIVKGTTNGGVTSLDGTFSLTAGSHVTLVISSIGYKPQEVAAAGRSYIKVVLEEEMMFLEDAVVVGYGTQKKENLTGAVSVISSKSIGKRSASGLGNILQGTVPGMTVTTPSGRPGESVSLNIRGWNSINSGGAPLVIVDGVVGSLDRVNPNDVESISVLKDASAASVYGAKAAFGVILVATKSGGEDESNAHVSYNGRFGFSAPTTSTEWETRGYYSVYIPNLFMKAFSGQQQILYDENDMYELWIRRDDVTENPERPWIIYDPDKGYKYYANTDWWHYFFNDRKPVQNHNISFRGGSKTIKYFLSANYNQEQGIFRINPDKYRKYNLRARVSFDVTPWLNISNNTAYYASNYTYPGLSDQDATFYQCTASYFSYLMPQTPEGTWLYKNNTGGGNQSILANLNNENFVNRTRSGNFTNTAEATITPFKQLEIKGNYTYSNNNYASLHRSVNSVVAGEMPMQTVTLNTDDNADSLSENMQTVDLHSANLYATYSDSFAEAHNLKVMVGGQFESYYHKKLTAEGFDLMAENLNDQNLVSADAEGNKRTKTAGGQSEYALLGFFGRINYDYKGKYLLELSARYDGTSRFPKGQRYGFFPSGSLGWRISEEPFFSPLKKWWNEAKVRFSYGSLGNQQVGYYDYIRSVDLGTQSYLFGGDKSGTATFDAPVASNLTWETVEQKNLGIDLAFLENRLTFTGEAYIRDTRNMLTTGKALPSVYGASAPKTNNADLRTKGYELSIGYRDHFNLLGDDFNFNVSATFNDFIGYITKFDNPTRNLDTYYEGMRYGEIWGYTTGGFFLSDEEAASYPVDQSPVCSIIYASNGGDLGLKAGDLKYLDLNGDNIIGPGADTVDNPGDRKIIGNSQPRYQYGLTFGFNWWGVDFSIFFQGVGHQDWYPSIDARYFWGPYARPFSSWIQKDFLDRCWSPENPDAYFPRPRAYIAGVGANRALTTVNDRYLQNIGYCRLKNLTVGYTLPQKWTRKVKIESLRLYFSGENLAYISPGLHSEYIDPEQASKIGKRAPIYPWQKTLMFGIDLNF